MFPLFIFKMLQASNEANLLREINELINGIENGLNNASLMRFSDLYAEDLNEKKMQSLKRDLEQVGKCLEQRFKNEDRLIIGLRLVHSIMKSN